MRKIDLKQTRDDFNTYLGNPGEIFLDDEALPTIKFRVADGVTPGGHKAGVDPMPDGEGYLYNDGSGNLTWSTSGGGIGSDSKEVKVTVGNTEYFAIVNRANNSDDGVESSAVAYDSNNNLIMLHVSKLYNNNTDSNDRILIISKFNDTGLRLWQYQIDQNVDSNTVHDLAIDADDNIIVAFSLDDGTESIGIIKFNPNGNVIWQKDYSNRPMKIGGISISGSNLYLAGSHQEIGLLMKVSHTDGNLIFAKTFDFGAITKVYGLDVNSNECVVVGVAEPIGLPNAAFATKFLSDGTPTWSQILFNPVEEISYTGGDVTIDTQNNIFISINSYQNIVHEINNTTQVTIAHVMKLNSSGAIQWTRRIGPGPCGSVATGLDSDVDGNVYLVALTSVQQNPNRDIDDFFNSNNVLVAAKYSTSGTVLWQRYIESDGYYFVASRNEYAPPGIYNPNVNRGRYMSLNSNGKLAVQVTAIEKDADNYTENTQYWESITFQIDQDGRTMTVGSGNEKFTVRESRVPGKMITIPNQLAPGVLNLDAVTNDITVSNNPVTLSDGELAQQISKSADYDYVFGNDGTFTIPNEGDVKLTQKQLGFFSVFGPAKNNNDDVWVRSNCVDLLTGDVYVVGQDNYDNRGFIAKYNSLGDVLWSTKLEDLGDGNDSRCNAVKIDPASGNLIVLTEYYGMNTNTSLLVIDPDTAEVISSEGFRDTNNEGDCVAYDFDVTVTGDVVVVGRKWDEYKPDSVTAQTGSGTGTLYVLRSEVAGTPTTSWYISGTGITSRVIIDNIDRYTGLTTTTNGSGQNCTVSLIFNADGTVNGVYSFDTPGTGYQVGDTLTISGTQFPGGTSPANNITMTVIDNSAPSNGVNGTNNISGNAPTTYWRLATTNQTPNYGVAGGSFSLLQPLNAEAFIVKGTTGEEGFDLTWTKVLSAGGEYDNERYYSVAGDGNGNWYAAGEMIADNNAAGSGLESYWCAVVSKFNDSGVHQWSKALNDDVNNCYAKSVAVRGNVVIVTHQNDNNGRTIVTKLYPTGSIKWQRNFYTGDDSSACIDTNGDIYVAAESYVESQYGNCIKVVKFDTSGEIIWRKILATQAFNNQNTREYFKNGRNLSIDADHFYVSGYTTAFANDYESGFLVKHPKSGDADGVYGSWTIMNDTYDVNKNHSTEATAFTPVIGIGDFETVNFEWATNWWDPSDANYYHVLEIVQDRNGGAIEFADGTRQFSSAQQIPQKLISTGADHRLSIEDMGKHIFVTNSDTGIAIPYNNDVKLPVGFTVVIINNSGGSISIDADGGGIYVTVPGVTSGPYWNLASPGIATLIKVDVDGWFMTGNVTAD